MEHPQTASTTKRETQWQKTPLISYQSQILNRYSHNNKKYESTLKSCLFQRGQVNLCYSVDHIAITLPRLQVPAVVFRVRLPGMMHDTAVGTRSTGPVDT